MQAKPGNGTSATNTAALLPDGLRWLVCPVCRAALKLILSDGSAPEAIQCMGCALVYPIVDGLPVLLRDRARG